VNNTITEIKNTLKETKSRMTQAEERISKLEDRMFEITEAEQNKEKRMKRNEREKSQTNKKGMSSCIQRCNTLNPCN